MHDVLFFFLIKVNDDALPIIVSAERGSSTSLEILEEETMSFIVYSLLNFEHSALEVRRALE